MTTLERSAELLGRILLGSIFIAGAFLKIPGTAGFASQVAMAVAAHMPFPTLAVLAALPVELLGGLALILGIATRIFGVVFGIEMLVATFIVGFGRGIGLELYLALVSFAIALMGSGAFSVFPMECGNCGGVLCDGEECVVVEGA